MAEQIISKRCTKCNEIKPTTEFYKNSMYKDGFIGWCKTCKKKYSQSEKGKSVHRTGSKRHSRTKKGIATKKRYYEKHKEENRPQKLARRAVELAIGKGQLPRPDSLQCACGELAEEYHHHKGYEPEHWLDVVPLCVKCHSPSRLSVRFGLTVL